MNILVPVPSAPITTGITNHFHVPWFFQFSSTFQIWISHFAFLQFYSAANQNGKIHNSAGLCFILFVLFFFGFFFVCLFVCCLFSVFCFFVLFTITRSGHLAECRSSVWFWKSRRILNISFFLTDFGLCIYHLLIWSNSNFLHNSALITLPIQSCLVLYALCLNLLHLLTQYLRVFHARLSHWFITWVWITASLFWS